MRAPTGCACRLRAPATALPAQPRRWPGIRPTWLSTALQLPPGCPPRHLDGRREAPRIRTGRRHRRHGTGSRRAHEQARGACVPDSFTCPVCGGHGAQVRLLVAAENVAALESFIGSARPAGVQVRDYALHRCDACTLGSSVPAIGGDEAFYSWATSFPGYYPEERWDWDAALARLVAVGAKNFIEAGCGLGSSWRRAPPPGSSATAWTSTPRPSPRAAARVARREEKPE